MWHNAHAPRGLSQPRAPGTTARDRPPPPAGARDTNARNAAIANCTQRPFRHTTSNRRCGWIVVNALFDEHQKMKRLPAYGVPPHARRIRINQITPLSEAADCSRRRSRAIPQQAAGHLNPQEEASIRREGADHLGAGGGRRVSETVSVSQRGWGVMGGRVGRGGGSVGALRRARCRERHASLAVIGDGLVRASDPYRRRPSREERSHALLLNNAAHQL